MKIREMMRVCEGEEGRSVRLYHAKGSDLWIAQTFSDDTYGRALAYASADDPYEALYGLTVQYQQTCFLESLGSLIHAFAEFRHAVRRSS